MHTKEAKEPILNKIDTFASFTCKTADNCDDSNKGCQFKEKLQTGRCARHNAIYTQVSRACVCSF